MDGPYLETPGLTLRAVPYGESGVYLTVLTRDMGKKTVRVRGARRAGSRLLAFAEPLVYADLTLFYYKDKLTLNEARGRSFFLPLRDDLSKLALATYLAEVTELLSNEDSPDKALLTLILTALHLLCENKHDCGHIKAVFEWRAAALAGYRPVLDVCAVCGHEPEEPYLHIDGGTVCCRVCRGTMPPGPVMFLGRGGRQAVRHCTGGADGRIFAFVCADSGWREAGALYLQTQLAHEFTSLAYYQDVK